MATLFISGKVGAVLSNRFMSVVVSALAVIGFDIVMAVTIPILKDPSRIWGVSIIPLYHFSVPWFNWCNVRTIKCRLDALSFNIETPVCHKLIYYAMTIEGSFSAQKIWHRMSASNYNYYYFFWRGSFSPQWGFSFFKSLEFVTFFCITILKFISWSWKSWYEVPNMIQNCCTYNAACKNISIEFCYLNSSIKEI